MYFDFDKYDIRPDSAQILRENAAWIKARRGYLILVEGYADERGTFEYNLALGEHRAAATRNFLIQEGVRADRLTTISYGKGRPVCTEETEQCWSRNRRAQFRAKPQ